VNPLTRNYCNLSLILNVMDVMIKHIMVNWKTSSYKVLIVVDMHREEDAQHTNNV
jgi:hypothetical protein